MGIEVIVCVMCDVCVSDMLRIVPSMVPPPSDSSVVSAARFGSSNLHYAYGSVVRVIVVHGGSMWRRWVSGARVCGAYGEAAAAASSTGRGCVCVCRNQCSRIVLLVLLCAMMCPSVCLFVCVS